jgi:hypothetical protein
MAHHHHHDNDDSYYIDQLCTVGISGTFAVICFALYFWQTQMLKYLLVTESIRFTLFLSGIALLAMALVRGFTLWGESKTAKAHAHDHQHAEGECCGHDHSHEDGHDHGHDHAHEHAHDHGHHDHHGHSHDHGDHSAEDHEHGSAPWRYVVMLLPVILFLLGLPNKGPSAGEFSGGPVDISIVSDIAAGEGEAEPVEFKRLFSSPSDSAERDDFADHVVRFRGQFTGSPEDPRFFQVVRFRGACCAADAQPMPILCVSKEPITGLKRDAWVWIEGKVQYAKRGDNWHLRILVPSASKVTEAQQDPNPYIQ